MAYSTSQLKGAILSVDGRPVDGGAVELPPNARLLLDLLVEETTDRGLLDELSAAVDEAKAARDEAGVARDQAEAIAIGDLSGTFVSQAAGVPVKTADPTALYRIDNDAATPVAKRVLQIRQDAAQYSVKIDHYGSDGHAVDITSHTDPSVDPNYTVLGVTGYNTDFGTVKFVNNAAQTGGAVVAAWGTSATRTAPIFVADNWGAGDGFQSVQRPGATGIAFRVAYDSGSTYTQRAIWIPARHSGGGIIVVENAVAQTSGSMLSLDQQAAGSTAPLVKLINAGTGNLIDASNFSVDSSGQVRTTQLFNFASFNNSKIALASTGTQITRNVGDGGVVLQVKQDNASGTGDLLNLQTSGNTVRSRFNKAGIFMTKVNAAPADADVGVGEVAFWFDSTSGAAKLMLKAKDAGGVVRTGQVALS